MSGGKPLAVPADVVYLYDGSFSGFLCCVYESVYAGELPADIAAEDEAQPTLLETRVIVTREDRAARVRTSIPAKISAGALELVYTVFLSCLEHRELRLLEFLLKAYRAGGRLLDSLGDPLVAPLLAAQRHLLGEANLLKGFIRFTDTGGALAAVITPKNFVLPFIMRHFELRYDREDFLIFDKTHKAALIRRGGGSEILRLDGLTLPEVSETEARYQALWKNFYDTVAVEGRENPRCRMTHMPKRYWENMLEVRGLL